MIEETVALGLPWSTLVFAGSVRCENLLLGVPFTNDSLPRLAARAPCLQVQ